MKPFQSESERKVQNLQKWTLGKSPLFLLYGILLKLTVVTITL